MTTPLRFFAAPYGHNEKTQGSDCAFREMGFPFGPIAPRPAYMPPGTMIMGRCPKPRRLRAEGIFSRCIAIAMQRKAA